jgi:hypothetical protein
VSVGLQGLLASRRSGLQASSGQIAKPIAQLDERQAAPPATSAVPRRVPRRERLGRNPERPADRQLSTLTSRAHVPLGFSASG